MLIVSSANALNSDHTKISRLVKSKSSLKRQVLDASNLKKFVDDDFRCDENGRKFSKWVENTVGKGEIARYEQFLRFPQCFRKTYTADT